MKKVVLIIILFLFSFTVVIHKVEMASKEIVDISTDKNDLVVYFLTKEQNKSLLLKVNEELIFLPIIEKESYKIDSILQKIGVNKIDYSFTSKISADKIISLNRVFSNENIQIQKKNENVHIRIHNDTFCIFKEGSLENCDYVYFLNETVIHDENIKLAFYDHDITSSFENELYNKWIDLYKINKDDLIAVKFYDHTYSVIRIPL